MDSTDPVDPLLLGEWLARYRYRLKYGSNNQLEAINKLRAILGLEADDEDIFQKAEQCMERLALSSSKSVEEFVITPAHVEHLFTVQPGQTKAAISEEDFMANFCTPVYWDSKVPEDMLPVMKCMYFHETGLDVDDPDGYAYGTSTFHFNNYIAGLVKKIDKSFGWFSYSGFGKLSREMREQLHRWLQQKKKDKDDQQKLESLKEPEKPEEPEDQLKRKSMFEDDSSEEESKKTPAADSSDEDGPPKKKKIMVDEQADEVLYRRLRKEQSHGTAAWSLGKFSKYRTLAKTSCDKPYMTEFGYLELATKLRATIEPEDYRYTEMGFSEVDDDAEEPLVSAHEITIYDTDHDVVTHKRIFAAYDTHPILQKFVNATTVRELDFRDLESLRVVEHMLTPEDFQKMGMTSDMDQLARCGRLAEELTDWAIKTTGMSKRRHSHCDNALKLSCVKTVLDEREEAAKKETQRRRAKRERKKAKKAAAAAPATNPPVVANPPAVTAPAAAAPAAASAAAWKANPPAVTTAAAAPTAAAPVPKELTRFNRLRVSIDEGGARVWHGKYRDGIEKSVSAQWVKDNFKEFFLKRCETRVGAWCYVPIGRNDTSASGLEAGLGD